MPPLLTDASDDLLSERENFLLVLSDRIGYRIDTAGWDAITWHEAVYLRAISTQVRLDSGGFSYFYEWAHWAADSADAFQALGLLPFAEAIRSTLKLWPDGRAPECLDSRLEMMDELEDELDDYFGPAEHVIIGETEVTLSACLDWVMANAEYFRDLERE